MGVLLFKIEGLACCIEEKGPAEDPLGCPLYTLNTSIPLYLYPN